MTLPTLTVELGLGGVPAGDYIQFAVNTTDNLPGFTTGVFAPSTFFTPVSSHRFVSGSSKRGRSQQLEQFTAGSADALLDDTDGRYDPNNLAGPYVSAGKTQLVPNVQLRMTATHLGTVYPICVMYVDQFLAEYDDPEGQSATVTATDGFKLLGRAEPAQAQSIDGIGEDTGLRMGRLLDAAGWSRTARDLDVGSSTLQGTTLETAYLSEIQDAVASEIGYAYIGPDGRFVFKNRTSRFTDTRSTVSQATFTDLAASALHYSSITPNNSDELMKNAVSVTIAGGSVQSVEDAVSRGINGISSHNVTNSWLQTDHDAANAASFILGMNKTIERRFDELTFDLLPNSTALFSALLPLDFGDLITAVRHTPAGTTITHPLFVEGIEWSFSGMQWGCTLKCSPARAWIEGGGPPSGGGGGDPGPGFLRFNDGNQAFNSRVFAF